MIMTIQGEYEGTRVLKMLSIDEETGVTKISLIDSSDIEKLEELHQQLAEGVSFADFQVIKTQDEDTGAPAYELRHFSTNIVPGEPDWEIDDATVKDSPTFSGFIRKMIKEEALVVLPLNDVPEQNIPYWMVANVNTIQFTDQMGMRISHLVPGSEEGLWRWTSSNILMNDYQDNFGPVTSHRFLCSTEFQPRAYEPYLEEHPERTVQQENGDLISYRVFSVKEDLPLFGRKSNILTTPATMSRIKFVADSYKLALNSLTEGLFAEKEIEYSSGGWSSSPVTGRFVKIHNKVPINKKTSSAMLEYLLNKMSNKTPLSEEVDILKKYPHYQVYESIVQSQVQMFFGENATTVQKFRAYRALKNVEAYLNLLLQECKYHAMFDNESYLFNLWVSTSSFKSDIPNYPVTVEGGGGTWRHSALFLL